MPPGHSALWRKFCACDKQESGSITCSNGIRGDDLALGHHCLRDAVHFLQGLHLGPVPCLAELEGIQVPDGKRGVVCTAASR